MPRARFRLLSAVLACATVGAAVPVGAAGPVISVGFGLKYLLIADGLANAFSASKIIVFPGTYQECVNVTGLVLLTIVGKKGAVIDATGCDAGLTVNDGEGITIKGLTITGAKVGIVVKPAATRVLVSKTVIQDPAVDPQLAVMQTGVQIVGANDVTLDGVTIRGANTQAVQVLLGTGTVVRKSTLADSVGDGVNLNFATRAVIEKNRMQNLGGPAVLGSGVDSLVASNKILFNPGGIQMGGTNNLIEKNTIADASAIGIQALVGSAGSIYRKNTMVRSADAAILADGTGDTFEKNTVKESLAEGVDVTGDGNVFLGGKVSAATGTGFLVRAAASGNRFEGVSSAKAGADGFRVEGTGNTFIKAKAAGSVGLDLNDPAGAGTTNVYTDCKFKTFNAP